MTHSMSHPGIPIDNLVIESLHYYIKRELIEPNKHKTRSGLVPLFSFLLSNHMQ